MWPSSSAGTQVIIGAWIGSYRRPARPPAGKGSLGCNVTGLRGRPGTGHVAVTSLPYRARPIDNPSFNYNLPYPVNHSDAKDWSSFPSDHAILSVGLAAGIFCAWKLGG